MNHRTLPVALVAASSIALASCQQKPAGSDNGTSATAAAATDIDGTWRADLASVVIDQKPNQFLLQNGQFSCSTCIPSFTVAADGAFHPTKRAYSDSTSVKVDDDHTVSITNKKGDTVVGTNKYTVSADGKTLTSDFTDSSVPNAKPVTGHSTLTRVSDGPAGAHLVSGGWKIAKYDNMSDEGLVVTFKQDGDVLHMTTPGGVSYDATIGGPAVPVKGDTSGVMASITKTGDRFVETDTRDGKTIGVFTFSVGADGKLHAENVDPRDGTKMTYTASRS